jgi:subtilase family serine protease
MAPNATINFITSGNSYFGGGIDASMEYAVENNAADVISESYGECESDLGADNAFYNIVYEQGAAQGQSIFISTGDSGPDSCSDGAAYAEVGCLHAVQRGRRRNTVQ